MVSTKGISSIATLLLYLPNARCSNTAPFQQTSVAHVLPVTTGPLNIPISTMVPLPVSQDITTSPPPPSPPLIAPFSSNYDIECYRPRAGVSLHIIPLQPCIYLIASIRQGLEEDHRRRDSSEHNWQSWTRDTCHIHVAVAEAKDPKVPSRSQVASMATAILYRCQRRGLGGMVLGWSEDDPTLFLTSTEGDV